MKLTAIIFAMVFVGLILLRDIGFNLNVPKGHRDWTSTGALFLALLSLISLLIP
jgi:hypothetical protein